MTLQIATLVELVRGVQSNGAPADAAEWSDLLEALKPYEEYPLQSLTTKLKQIVLKKPAAKKPKPTTTTPKPRTTTSAPRAKKPKLSESERTEIVETHIRRLKEAFDDDGAFDSAFEAAKGDAALDAKLLLKLFESVIGPANFPTEPLRKPTILKQLREQRNTIAYRRGRTGQTADS